MSCRRIVIMLDYFVSRNLLICLLLLLCGCKEKQYDFAKGKIVKIEYQTVARGTLRTKFICTFRYHGKDEVGYALGKTHFGAMAEASIGDSVLIQFDKENIHEGVVRHVFYFERNIHGEKVDNTYYRGRYNQLE